MNSVFLHLAAQVGELLKSKQLMLTTAESCTGGQIAYWLTSIAGSSYWFERGFVCYSNDSKKELLDVRAPLLQKHGAVSEQIAQAMAEGALKKSAANVSLAVTGVAGPDGGTPEKPVGTVWLAWAAKGQPTEVVHKHFHGDRVTVRDQASITALNGLMDFLQRHS